MAPPVSSGTLLYRRPGVELEVLLVHRSGEASRHKPWSIPKGLPDGDEALEAAARRETWEETGVRVTGALVPLGMIEYRKKSRKQVWCFAGPAPVNAAPRLASWEVDKAEFVLWRTAETILHPDQQPFLARLADLLRARRMALRRDDRRGEVEGQARVGAATRERDYSAQRARKRRRHESLAPRESRRTMSSAAPDSASEGDDPSQNPFRSPATDSSLQERRARGLLSGPGWTILALLLVSTWWQVSLAAQYASVAHYRWLAAWHVFASLAFVVASAVRLWDRDDLLAIALAGGGVTFWALVSSQLVDDYASTGGLRGAAHVLVENFTPSALHVTCGIVRAWTFHGRPAGNSERAEPR